MFQPDDRRLFIARMSALSTAVCLDFLSGAAGRGFSLGPLVVGRGDLVLMLKDLEERRFSLGLHSVVFDF